MPSFKPKTDKRIIVNQKANITLDGKHNEILHQIHINDTVTLPEIERRINSIRKKIKLLKNSDIDEKLILRDEMDNLKERLRENKHMKTTYLLDNAKYVFDYFENKKEISTGKNVVNNSILDSFFKVKTDKPPDGDVENKDIVKQYLSNVDESFIDVQQFIQPSNICPSCEIGELIPVDDEGILVCNKCSKQLQFLTENEKPSYKEPPKEVCFYAYKRINHFREILAQFQAKETTQIPENVIEDIKNQIKKERIELKQITNTKAKEILKKLGHNKYYEHIPFIKDIIGIKPPVMTPELEDTLCNLFMDIQAPYAKFCPDDRVNFLNYYYTVYKLCELLEQRQFLPFFPMLKDREKRIDQDNVWKQICDELDWEFIPTI